MSKGTGTAPTTAAKSISKGVVVDGIVVVALIADVDSFPTATV